MELSIGLIILGLAVATVWAIRHYGWFVAVVEANSMLPTLVPNERILMARIHQPAKLRRGDIVAVLSDELKQVVIKRLIGLPGDHVVIQSDGQVLVNGNPLDEDYVHYSGGTSGSYLVPTDEIFLLGDNRNQSNDSRHWRSSTLPIKQLEGRMIRSLSRPK